LKPDKSRCPECGDPNCQTLDKVFDISEERMEELLRRLDPTKFEFADKFAFKVRGECKNDGELNFMIAHIMKIMMMERGQREKAEDFIRNFLPMKAPPGM